MVSRRKIFGGVVAATISWLLPKRMNIPRGLPPLETWWERPLVGKPRYRWTSDAFGCPILWIKGEDDKGKFLISMRVQAVV